MTARRTPAAHLCLRVGSRHEVAFVPFPARAPMFVIGAAGTLVSFTLPEQIDADPEARQRTVKVKIAAQVQPVLPSPAPGSPFTAVEFDGLTVTPYPDGSRCQGGGKNKCAARQAYSLKATGVRAPSRGIGRPAEHKDAA